MGHREADCWIKQAYESWKKKQNGEPVQGTPVNQEAREKGQADIREYLKRKRDAGEDVGAIQALMKSLPEVFCFAIVSGQFRDLTEATPVENLENGEDVESWEEQAWFWDDLEDETECSPCYFDVGNHGHGKPGKPSRTSRFLFSLGKF